jgi:hypothetical protein
MPHEVAVAAAALALPARIRGLLATAALERQQAGRLRRQLEDAIEELIGLLDELDAEDEDLEPDGSEEPTLGWPEGGHVTPLRSGDTRDGENEWSLGSLTGCTWAGSQSFWAGGEPGDFEDEHDGREPDEDGEPALGAPEGHAHPDNLDQTGWARGGSWDGEVDDSDRESDGRDLPKRLDAASLAKWRKERREPPERPARPRTGHSAERRALQDLEALLRRIVGRGF